MNGRAGYTPSPFPLALLLVLLLHLVSCSGCLKSSSPKRNGQVTGDVSDVVHVYRDLWGVPHIFADTTGDLLYGQGFVHAQERLFQLDAERRIASGTLSEILGEKTLPVDRLFRILGLKGLAEEIYSRLDGESKYFVDRYVDGVNRYMEVADSLPVEFRLLGFRPERYRADDVILNGLLKSFGLSQWLEKFAYYTVLAKAGPAYFEEINPFHEGPWELEIISPRAVLEDGLPLRDLANLFDAVSSLSSFPVSGGSNSWVISGGKSSDGFPYLANDPHLPLSAPSVWFENHLVSPEISVYGFSFPGTPFVIIGFNKEVAWGLTNVMLDDVDFFFEKEVRKGETYRYRGRDLSFEKRVEKIRIKGKKVQSLEVLRTVHGPVIGGIFPGIDKPFSLRWTAQDATGKHIRSLFLLNGAKSPEDIRKALSYFELSAQNVLFATRVGDIGYQLAGKIPMRKKNHPPLPVPGDTGEFDWLGYHPFDENPSVLNPPSGFLATANFPPLPRGNGLYISSVYEPPARGKRIIEVLSKKDSLSPGDLKSLQNDVLSLPAEKTVPLILKAVSTRRSIDASYRRALTILSNWDLRMSPDSCGAAIFSVFYEMLLDRVFMDELGKEGLRIFKQTVRVPTVSLDHLLFEKPDSMWFDDGRTPEKENREQIVAETFEEALSYLKDRLGENPDGWAWGKLHRISMRHPFGEKWYLKRFFNIGPEPVGGDSRTVFKTEFPHGLDFSVLVGPSLRMVVSPGKTDEAVVVLSTGQSGHFYEKHYRDQLDLWLQGRYRNVILDRGDIEEHFSHHLWISPPDKQEKSPME